MKVTTNAAVTCCVLLSLLVQSVCAQDPKLGPFPETISKEAKAFLIRTKGNIIDNYILQDGQPVLEQSYREGEPSLQITEDTIGGVKAFWVSSKMASSDKTVVIYFHGGGYVVGDGKADGGFILPVFEALGVKGLSVDYRLAPQHPFPAAVEDAVAVYRGLLEKNYKPEQIAFTGDSAGGGLALAAVLSLKTSGDPLPAAIAVISPGFLDAQRPGDTWLTLREKDPFVGREGVEGNIKKYAGKAPLDNPLLSPIYGNYEGFPPLLIQVGTREMLLSDSVQLARKAREAGVDVTLDVWEGMWHSFHMQWPIDIPESQQACKFMADFLRKHLREAVSEDESTSFKPDIPKVWDEEALASLELPLADGNIKTEHTTAEYYYNLPVRQVYRQYPIYAPGREQAGYFESLLTKEPEIVFDASRLRTKDDWINAGRLIFSAPMAYIPVPPEWRDKKVSEEYLRVTEDRLTADGVVPFFDYVIREKGKVEVGIASCADCHTRVMPDGSLILGAQGNRPLDKILANLIRIALANDPKEEAAVQHAHMTDYGAPWIKDSRNNGVLNMSATDLARWHQAIPPGVMSRQGSSLFWPVQVPDLIGIKNRRYLDKTGLVRHRTIADLMRYAVLNQGMDYLTKFGDFIPAGKNFKDTPDAEQLPKLKHLFASFIGTRYSDEQLYALALYLYSVEPPPNPNKFNALVKRGEGVFESEDCGRCHTPPHYTSNRLTPVDGFDVPNAHYRRFDIEDEGVGTDPNSALKTRRGTGYYKIPTLKGLWYRGPLEHNGSVATLEDWFDSNRLKPNYAPTGWKPADVKTRAVLGHEYGLDLSDDDKAALIAFLRTL